MPPDSGRAPADEEGAPEAEEAPGSEEKPEGGDSIADSARRLAEAFDAAAVSPDAPVPSMFEAQHTLLALHCLNDFKAARRLHRSAAAWLRASGQESRVLRGDAAAVWALTRELGALPGSFSPEIRATIARSAVSGDFSLVTEELAVFRKRWPRAAKKSADTLREKAPMIAAMIADTLDPPKVKAAPAPAPASGDGSWRGLWVIIVIVLGLVRVLAAGSSSSRSSFDPSRFPPAKIEMPHLSLPDLDAGIMPPLDNVFRDLAILALDRLKQHVRAQSADAGASRKKRAEALSKDIKELDGALAHGDCVVARARATAIRAAFSPDGGLSNDAVGLAMAINVDSDVSTYCIAVEARRDPRPVSP
ncbi:Hypothetical protein A7982_09053 [Minicystis rosea]|nr:Hypothetical protein A7982_09053 [Minicystis rosea]